MFDLHPEIARGLREAFGDEPVEDLAPLTGGRSGATLLSLRVAGRGYVVRRPDSTRDAHAFRLAREVACLKAAAEGGVAPRLRHLDAATGVCVMERVEVVPSADRARYVERVARTLRRLHRGPAFPKGTSLFFVVHYVDEVLRARGAGGLPEPLVRTMDELTILTRPFAETAPCHLDLNPGNLLDAADAVYFVDWETAGAGDPFVDLAELGVFAFPGAAERAQLLEAYLERPPTAQEQARDAIARVMALGFYATAFFRSMALAGQPVRGAAPLPIPEMLALLHTSREPSSLEVVAVSLFEEMRRSSKTEAYEAARAALASS